MLLTKTVKMRINNFNVDFYKNKGYDCKIGDTINIKTTDVSSHSKHKIELLCDECKVNKKEISIESLCKQNCYKDGVYICSECSTKILNNRRCEICGSTHKVTNYLNQGRLLCQRHQKLLRKEGCIRRTMNDPNEIRLFNNYLEFDTYDINGKVNGTFKADLDMENFIKCNKLHKHKDGYACYKFKDKNGKTKNMRFHRYVMNVHLEDDEKTLIDHINRDKSDNRKENLRKASSKDNIVNTGLSSTNTSGHKGVSWDKKQQKWESYIHKNNKKISLGFYVDFDKAVEVREIAEIIYFGEKNPNYKTLINKYIDNKQVKQYLLQNQTVNNKTRKER